MSEKIEVASATSQAARPAEAGKRNTWQKDAVKHALSEAIGFVSAQQLHQVLRNHGSTIGLATVYRVLAQFEQAGLLNRSNFESGKAVYEINEGQHHDHLVCLDCGKVEEFYDAEIEKRQNDVAQTKGFTIADHSLSIYANCTKTACPHRTLSTRLNS
ncbi:MAG: hypothetical protein RLZZ90_821 [Actinomycetota bacterium]